MADVGIVLVDYDNIIQIKEKTAGDVMTNLEGIIPVVISEAKCALADTRELLIRVYGGWVNERGHHSRRAQWLLTILPQHRGRRDRMIIKPSLATSLACRPSDVLLGSVRDSPTGIRQKMVDTMLCLDALYFTRECKMPVILVSDDDDLVPAALATRTSFFGARTHWLRRRLLDSGLNDALLKRAGVTFACLQRGIP